MADLDCPVCAGDAPAAAAWLRCSVADVVMEIQRSRMCDTALEQCFRTPNTVPSGPDASGLKSSGAQTRFARDKALGKLARDHINPVGNRNTEPLTVGIGEIGQTAR